MYWLLWEVIAVVSCVNSDCFWCHCTPLLVPSVLWRCWFVIRKGIRPAENWVMRYWHGYLSGATCKWFAYGPSDATVTPSSLASLKSRMAFTFLVPSYRGCPGKRPLNGRLSVCLSVVNCLCDLLCFRRKFDVDLRPLLVTDVRTDRMMLCSHSEWQAVVVVYICDLVLSLCVSSCLFNTSTWSTAQRTKSSIVPEFLKNFLGKDVISVWQLTQENLTIGLIANLKGPYFQPSLSVCLCVSDRNFYPSALTDFD